MAAATFAASSSDGYFVRGQKNPFSPSPLVRGTTCVCRCGTLWLTTLLSATNEPCAPIASRTATLIAWSRAKYGPTSAAGRSARVTIWVRGTTSTCPGNSGRMSRNAATRSSAYTMAAGRSPAAISQNRHAAMLCHGTSRVPTIGPMAQAPIGRFEQAWPAAERPDLVAPAVIAALPGFPYAGDVLVVDTDPANADTAVFGEVYGVAPELSANCVVVAGRRGETTTMAACVI